MRPRFPSFSPPWLLASLALTLFLAFSAPAHAQKNCQPGQASNNASTSFGYSIFSTCSGVNTSTPELGFAAPTRQFTTAAAKVYAIRVNWSISFTRNTGCDACLQKLIFSVNVGSIVAPTQGGGVIDLSTAPDSCIPTAGVLAKNGSTLIYANLPIGTPTLKMEVHGESRSANVTLGASFTADICDIDCPNLPFTANAAACPITGFCADFKCVDCSDMSAPPSELPDANCQARHPTRPYCVNRECVECPADVAEKKYCTDAKLSICAGRKCVECPYATSTYDTNFCPQDVPCDGYQCKECSNNTATPLPSATCATNSPSKPFCANNDCVECANNSNCNNRPGLPNCVANKCSRCSAVNFTANHAQCPTAPTRHCANGDCVECRFKTLTADPTYCPATKPLCANYTCVTCDEQGNEGVPSTACQNLNSAKPLCAAHQCVACRYLEPTVDATHCTDPNKPVCSGYQCFACVNNSDCQAGFECVNNSCVVSTQRCDACQTDAWCNSNAAGGAKCGTGRNKCRPKDNLCVECLNDNDCPFGQKCSAINTCLKTSCPTSATTPCTTNNDCVSSDCGSRIQCISGTCTDPNAQAACQPPNLLIILDQSCSMGSSVTTDQACSSVAQCTMPAKYSKSCSGGKCVYSRWDVAVNAVKQVTTDYGGTAAKNYEDRRVRFGLEFFSSGSSLTNPIIGDPPAIATALDARGASGGTNYVSAFTTAKSYFQNTLFPNDPNKKRRTAILFITDGGPNEGCSFGSSPSIVDSIYNMAGPDGTTKSETKTYTVGFGTGLGASGESCLNTLAQYGKTTRACFSQANPTCGFGFYASDSQAQLQEAFKQIIQNATAEECDGLDNNCDGQVDEGNPGGTCNCVKSFTKNVSTSFVEPTASNVSNNVSLYTILSSFSNQGKVDPLCNPPNPTTPSDPKLFQDICRNRPFDAATCSAAAINAGSPAGNAFGLYCSRCCSDTGTGLSCNWPSDHACKVGNRPWIDNGTIADCKLKCTTWCGNKRSLAVDCTMPRGIVERVGTGFDNAGDLTPKTYLDFTADGFMLAASARRLFFNSFNGTDASDARSTLGGIGFTQSASMAFDVGNLATIKPLLRLTDSCATPPCPAAVSASWDDDVRDVIATIRGASGFTKADRAYRMGPVYNSTPAVSGPPSTNLEDASYRAWLNRPLSVGTVATRPAVTFIGSNDGILHAFHLETGEELWGFLPFTTMGRLAYAISGRMPKGGPVFTVDGTPTIRNVKVRANTGNNDWSTIMIVGYRTGGKGYTAFDITDPLRPKLLWEVTEGSRKRRDGTTSYESNIAAPAVKTATFEFGYSIGQATIARMLVPFPNASSPLTERAVALLPGGVEIDDNPLPPVNTLNLTKRTGSALYIVDIETGDLLSEVHAFDQARSILPSMARGLTSTPVGFGSLPALTTRVFVSDVLGRVWWFNPSSRTVSNRVRLFLDTFKTESYTNPVMSSLALALNSAGEIVLFGGTGDTVNIDLINGFNKVFSIREEVSNATFLADGTVDRETIRPIHNYIARLNKTVTLDANQNPVSQAVSATYTGERVTGDPLIVSGTAYFTTYTPTFDQPICGVSGFARVFGIGYNEQCYGSNCGGFMKPQIYGPTTPTRCCEPGNDGCSNASSNLQKYANTDFYNSWASATPLSPTSLCSDLDYTVPLLSDYSTNPARFNRYFYLGPNTLSMGPGFAFSPGLTTVSSINGNAMQGHDIGYGRDGRYFVSVQVSGRNPINNANSPVSKGLVIKPSGDPTLGKGNFVTVDPGKRSQIMTISSWGNLD